MGKDKEDRVLQGRLRTDADFSPVVGAKVRLQVAAGGEALVMEDYTDERGGFAFTAEAAAEITELSVFDRDGGPVWSSLQVDEPRAAARLDLDILLPAASAEADIGLPPHIGTLPVAPEDLARTDPGALIQFVHALLIGQQTQTADAPPLIAALHAVLAADRSHDVPILRLVEDAAGQMDPSGAVARELRAIVACQRGGHEHHCDTTHFRIAYNTSKTKDDSIDDDNGAVDVFEPGTQQKVKLTTLPAGGHPKLVKLIEYWLEKAWQVYTAAPFNMIDPTTKGDKIPVEIVCWNDVANANADGIWLNHKITKPDKLAVVMVHELFHVLQLSYPKNFAANLGLWKEALTEGMATAAEDTVADKVNRYIAEADQFDKHLGLLSDPSQNLFTRHYEKNKKLGWLTRTYSGYESSLFWRYMAEQTAAKGGPQVNVATYRRIFVKCRAGDNTTQSLRAAIRDLPWQQDFLEHAYLDKAAGDRISAETAWGNFALACYIKDLPSQDRRFAFAENDEPVFMDDIWGPDAKPQDTMAKVRIDGRKEVNTSNDGIQFYAELDSLARRYYEVTFGDDIDELEFKIYSSSDDIYMQLVLIEPDGQVRDIYRQSKAERDLGRSKYLAIARQGVRLAKVLVVVSRIGDPDEEESKPAYKPAYRNFSLDVMTTRPRPDVMITRWNCAAGREYEVDPRDWAWTWTSPDIWLADRDGNPTPAIIPGANNNLTVRLHNKGNLDAFGFRLSFHYQEIRGPLSASAWQPVRDIAGMVQKKSSLSLDADSSAEWSVPWCPPQKKARQVQGYAVRVTISYGSDIDIDLNRDNKSAITSFGFITLPPGGHARIDADIPQADPPERRLAVPRVSGDFHFVGPTMQACPREGAAAQACGFDIIGVKRVRSEEGRAGAGKGADRPEPAAANREAPDGNAYYAPDPRILPDGLDALPMVTVDYTAAGFAAGGCTYFVHAAGGP